MSLDNKEKESTVGIEEQVANIFQRARGGKPFGTKEDVNVLIDKICDHIYRKLIEENWCPCDRHSNTTDAESLEDINCEVNASGTEGYMQRIRRKVLEILSDYLATFKNQLFTNYGIEPTDPMIFNEETDPDSSTTLISGHPSSNTMVKSVLSAAQIERGVTAGLQSVTNTNVCDNSLSDISINDWLSVGRCLSRENYFDQSPPHASISASPATLRWSSDPNADGILGAYRKPDRRTQSHTATPREVENDRDNTRGRSTGDKPMVGLPEDKLTSRETFKKTLNPKLIKKSQGSMEKPRQKIMTTPLLTETDDYHPEHFMHDKETDIDRDIDAAEVGAADGDSHNGSVDDQDVPTHIGGIPYHLFGERGSVDYGTKRLRSRRRSVAVMKKKASNVVHFLMKLRKPV